MAIHFNRGRLFQIKTLCFIEISDHSVCNVPVVEPRKIIMKIQRREKEFKVICKHDSLQKYLKGHNKDEKQKRAKYGTLWYSTSDQKSDQKNNHTELC